MTHDELPSLPKALMIIAKVWTIRILFWGSVFYGLFRLLKRS